MKQTTKRFKVIGTFRDSGRSYWIINYKGDEYYVAQLPCQKGPPSPKELNCKIIEEDDGGKLLSIRQDYAPIIRELYKPGNEVEVTLRDVRGSFWKAVDKNGFAVRLPATTRGHYSVNQKVTVKITAVEDEKIDATIVLSAKDFTIAGRTLAEVAAVVSLDEEALNCLRVLITEHADFAAIERKHDMGDGSWVLDAVIALDSLLMSIRTFRPDEKRLVEVFSKLCMYVLEKSDMLRQMSTGERQEWLQRVSAAATHAQDYEEAFTIWEAQQARPYLEAQLTSLQESGYLYQPERKLRVMMCLFNLDDDLMGEMLDRVFEIIMQGNKDHWMAEPFRTAFVNLLEMFIAEQRNRAIRSKSIEMITKVIRAIAIQQLLANDNDDIDRRLNRATYYRLLSYIERDYSDDLLDEALDRLFSPYNSMLEYTWDDIPVIENLYWKSAYRQKSSTDGVNDRRQPARRVFRGDNVALIVDGDRMGMRPVEGSPERVDLKGLPGWKGFTLLSNTTQWANKPKAQATLNETAAWCDEVFESLWDECSARRAAAAMKLGPEPDDRVVIRVIDEDEDKTSLYCEVTGDNGWQGHGWLDYTEMTMYLRPGTSSLHLFRDNTGTPLQLQAAVIGTPDKNGEVELSLKDDIDEYFMSLYSVGQEVELIVCTTCHDADMGDCYACVTTDGASALLLQGTAPKLDARSRVTARIQERNRLGQIVCDYTAISHRMFSVPSSLQRLLRTLADIAATNKNAEAAAEAATMDLDDVTPEMDIREAAEIMWILDRKAVLAEDRRQSYALLNIARALARMMGDELSQAYYRKRQQILLAFDDYERNGCVNAKSLNNLIQDVGQELIDTDYLVSDSISKFRILDTLRRRDGLDTLYTIRETALNTSVRNAADLALALLLTDRFALPNVNRLLLDRINREIGVEVRQSTLQDFGEETQEKEFKSSLVYHARSKMRPSPELQGTVIMQTICGFLNSPTGGTLYLGVQDTGVATGLDDDMRYLKVDHDGYTRYLTGMVRRELGQNAAMSVHTRWQQADGYEIMVVEIDPAPELVRFRGQPWLRIGTEKVRANPGEISRIERRHADDYAAWRLRRK